MIIEPLAIEGAFLITPEGHKDERGEFHEWYRPDLLAEATGADWTVRQANMSRSRRGALRGIHFAQVPPGQAKYVTCVSGRVADVVVDVRVGSPTFGQWDSVLLETDDRRAVFLSEGLGQGFVSLADGSTVAYLCNQPYAPGREHEVHPLDPEIGIDWQLPSAEIELSPKDAAAPSLAEAAQAGRLPTSGSCENYVTEHLRD